MPYVADMNGDTREGVAYFQHNVDGRFRSQPAQTYLRIARNRPNLQVKVEAIATKILFEGRRAIGVTYLQGGQARKVVARKEVIVCAGVFKSPHLLQLSGIGDPALLRDIGVPVVDRQSLRRSQPARPFPHQRRTARARHRHVEPDIARAAAGEGVAEVRRPRHGSPDAWHGQCRLLLSQSTGLPAPDAQLMFVHGSYGPVPGVLEKEPGVTIGSWPSHPTSHGTVFARTADALDRPAIHLNFLSSEDDQRIVIECVRKSRAIFASRAMSPWSVGEVKPGADVRTDDEVIAFARQYGRSGMHFAGTCRMGSDDAAVVDPQLRVKGVSGLRVVDASVMPNCTVGNINATIVAMAERAADLVSVS